MTSSDLLLLGEVGEALVRTLASGRLSPSYLFEGVDADEAARAARAFAGEVLALDLEEAAASRARRRAASGEHADLVLLGKDKPTVISVAALEPALARAHQTPLEGGHQVIVVDPADAMEDEGVARYLKALEEPPEGTVFVLVTTHAERLPSTVLSRCRRVRVPPVPRDRMEAALVAEGQPGPRARDLARWATGSLARARRIDRHRLDDVARALAEAAWDRSPRVGQAADGALAHLVREAAAWAEDQEAARGDLGREGVRTLLADVLHVLSVEARDVVAEREAPLLGGLAPQRALDLLERLGAVAEMIPLNVAPAVLLIETGRAVRDAAFA